MFSQMLTHILAKVVGRRLDGHSAGQQFSDNVHLPIFQYVTAITHRNVFLLASTASCVEADIG